MVPRTHIHEKRNGKKKIERNRQTEKEGAMSQEASVVGLGPPGITVMAAVSESTFSSLPL